MRSRGWYPEAGPRRRHPRRGFGGDLSNHFPQGPDHPLPHASKMSGQKVAPRAATWDAVSWKVRLRVTTSWKTSETGGVAEEVWEVRSKDETERSQASANPDKPQRSRCPRGGVTAHWELETSTTGVSFSFSFLKLFLLFFFCIHFTFLPFYLFTFIFQNF